MNGRNRIVIASLGALAAVLVAGAWFLGRMSASATGGDPASGGSGEREILYWVAPMDANFRRDEPGKSPMGMDLVPVYADEVDTRPGVVTIDPAVVNNLGVRTAPATRGPLPRRIETVGYVAYDEDTVTHVHTRVDGWIRNLDVKASGDPVTAGQRLFELYSPTLVNAQEEFLAALAGGNRNLVGASAARLDALGMPDREIERLRSSRSVSETVRVFAETDGVVTDLGVREGVYVSPATHALSIAKLDTVWLLAEVFERQSSWVRAGQRALVELDYLPGRRWQAEVDYVYPELDPETRTLTVRLRLGNEDGVLRPNMFGRVTIFGDDTTDVVHVPREALIRGGDVDRVVVALGAGRFEARAVEAGIEAGDRVAILDGIAAGEPVVVSGQFLIDSESNLDTSLSRLGGESDDGHAGHGTDAADHADHDMSGMDHSGHDMDGMDHSGHDMDHSTQDAGGTDHSGHDMNGTDRAGHAMDGDDHAGHANGQMQPDESRGEQRP